MSTTRVKSGVDMVIGQAGKINRDQSNRSATASAVQSSLKVRCPKIFTRSNARISFLKELDVDKIAVDTPKT